MAVTSRDEELLSGIGCFRVMTIKHIQRYYFDGLARPLVQRRLGILRREGLVRAFAFGPHGERAWTLTSAGARQLKRPPRIFVRPPNLNTLPHDLSVVDLGLQLRKFGFLYDWVSAYELEARTNRFKSDKSHVPDAIFRLKIGDKVLGPIGLEVEHSLKTRDRLLSVVDEYRHLIQTSDLWFFWKKDWMGRTLRELPVSQKPRIWIAENPIGESVNLRLRDLEGKLLDLELMAASAPNKGDTPPDTSEITPSGQDAKYQSSHANSDIERLRVRRTPNSDGLITRDTYPYTSTTGVGVTAGPLENGVRGTGKENGKEKKEEEEKTRGLGEMTRGIKGLESGVRG